MNSKYQQAIKAGLVCGLVIAIIYLALCVADQYLNSTPAMASYYDQALKPFHDMMKDWPYVSGQYSYPENMPGPPGEYYLSAGIRLASLGVLVIGLLLAGAYALIMGKQPKYSSGEAAYMGAISGAAAFVPLLVAQLIMVIIATMWQGPAHTMISYMPGSASASLPFIAAAGCCCCCLPAGIVLAVIVSAIGALGYALLANRLGS